MNPADIYLLFGISGKLHAEMDDKKSRLNPDSKSPAKSAAEAFSGMKNRQRVPCAAVDQRATVSPACACDPLHINFGKMEVKKE